MNPLGHERYCMAQLEDDGKSELTVTLIYGGDDHTLVFHNEAEQRAAAMEGWLAFISPDQ